MTNQKKVILKVDDFTGFVNKVKLFENITFSLEERNILVLYGPRGSGKSALLRSFARLNEEIFDEVKYDGEVFLEGENLFDYDIKQIRNFVFYSDTNFFEALDYLTFGELIELAIGKEFLPFEEYSSLLDDFGLLKALVKGYKTKLSDLYVLEKISILLFLSYLKDSKLVIFDCILDHLDDEHLKELSFILKKRILSADKALILATRFFKRFLPIADLFIFMKNGKIEFEGKPKDFTIAR
ncbi:ATP-binding cassette domain-containing protein [Thermosipho atlanticus]|uniref:ABC-type cobalamin/Fe3+-siderophores transport system, ATPase component n=1 Tax=Thermosipho atlanticus DSM 15807 TaxID=1123380 RepID=A0A1M5T5M3_9BACT|nr:ATP-binding cassette domain-containing protein [Thermosipho atlanticus]SHH45890.1 ABC-type cobalamin/Fe3+-siderophores transport system, ATPase component [Thermosipho atlanticus DSM 15807]